MVSDRFINALSLLGKIPHTGSLEKQNYFKKTFLGGIVLAMLIGAASVAYKGKSKLRNSSELKDIWVHISRGPENMERCMCRGGDVENIGYS